MSALLTPEAAASPRARRSRNALVVLVVLVVATVAVGLLAGAQRWRTGLDVVAVQGQDVAAPVEVGPTYYVDAGVGPVADDPQNPPQSVTVAVDSVSAGADLLTTNVAGSSQFTGIDLATVVCIRKPGSSGVGIAVAADLAASCSSVRPIRAGETLDLGFETAQILYVVPVAARGTYQSFGIALDYHLGLRQGSVRGSASTKLVAAG